MRIVVLLLALIVGGFGYWNDSQSYWYLTMLENGRDARYVPTLYMHTLDACHRNGQIARQSGHVDGHRCVRQTPLSMWLRRHSPLGGVEVGADATPYEVPSWLLPVTACAILVVLSIGLVLPARPKAPPAPRPANPIGFTTVKPAADDASSQAALDAIERRGR